MNNTKALENIEEARNEIKKWLDDAKSLLSGDMTEHNIQEPVSCTDCSFGVWLQSEEQSQKGKIWFDEIAYVHRKSHEAFSTLYHETQRIYNPKSCDELQEYYSHLEMRSNALVDILAEAEEWLREETVVEVKTQQDTIIEDIKVDLEIPPFDIADSFTESEKYLDEYNNDEINIIETNVISETVPDTNNSLFEQLKEQDLIQIEHKKELLKLEVKQLEDRHTLTKQGIDQLKQYQLLKQKEQEQLKSEIKNEESSKQEEFESKTIELNELVADQKQKQNELEQMEQVSQKLNQKKSEEKVHLEEEIENLVEHKSQITTELEKLDEKKSSKEKDLERFEQQVLDAKKNIEELEKQQLTKDAELKTLDETLNVNQKEFESDNMKQQQLHKQKHEIEAQKQAKLKEVEAKQASLKIDLEKLEHDLSKMSGQKENTLSSINKLINQLDKEYAQKTKKLKKLEGKQKQKQQDLAQLEEVASQDTALNSSKNKVEEASEQSEDSLADVV